MPISASISAITPENASVSLTRIGSRLSGAVSRPSIGDNRLLERSAGCGGRTAIDLLAQVADIHLDDVRAVLVLIRPRVLEQLVPRQDLAGTADEGLEQRELLG